MTKNKAIEIIRYHKALVDRDKSGLLDKSLEYEAIDMAIKALEQPTSDDVMAIHTQGLAEGVRCAMCTNSMRNDRGCDGGCVVNEDMYKEVMNTINNHIFEQPTSDDCVDINHVIATISQHHFDKDKNNFDLLIHNLCKEVKELPPVTPTHGTCKDYESDLLDFISAMNMCDEISNEAYAKISNHCADFEKRGSENRQAVKMDILSMDKLKKIEQIIDDCDLEAWEVLKKIKEVLEQE